MQLCNVAGDTFRSFTCIAFYFPGGSRVRYHTRMFSRSLFLFLLFPVTACLVWLLMGFFDAELDPNASHYKDTGTRIEEGNGQSALMALVAPKETPTPSGDAFRCWLQQAATKSPRDKCPGPVALQSALSAHQEMLTDYIALQQYALFSPTGYMIVNDAVVPIDHSRLVKLHTLYMAQLVHKSRLRLDPIPEWIANERMLRTLLASGQTTAMSSAIMTMMAHSADTLAVIVQEKPELARAHRLTLLTQLNAPAFGPQGWDVRATLKQEYSIVEWAATLSEHSFLFARTYRPNATRNLFVNHAQWLEHAAQAPIDTFPEALAEAKQYMKRPFGFYNRKGVQITEQNFTFLPMLEARMQYMARQQQLSLYVAAKAAGIPREAMGDYILQSPYKNPVTQKPFLWNPDTAQIGSDLQDAPERRLYF